MDSFLGQYWPNFIGTVTGGLVLSTIYFLLKEWVFSLPKLTGIWECELIVQKSAYNPYAGMKLWYRITLIQNGNQIGGHGELDREDATTGKRRFEGRGRRVIEVIGKIEKNITRPDRVHLVWVEDGENRKFSSVFDLCLSGSKVRGNLWGTYASTAAESSGHSAWSRLE